MQGVDDRISEKHRSHEILAAVNDTMSDRQKAATGKTGIDPIENIDEQRFVVLFFGLPMLVMENVAGWISRALAHHTLMPRFCDGTIRPCPVANHGHVLAVLANIPGMLN